MKKMLSEKYDELKLGTRACLAPIRNKTITDTSFSIISNNCWGGLVYQRYGLPYSSPTVGLYFFADDYIRLLADLKGYMAIPITIIPVEESNHRDLIISRHQERFPIGRIGDVEIVFRHYLTPEEAIEKWERRKKRINYENLIIKFSEMNQCSEDMLYSFSHMPYSTKFAFVSSNRLNDNCFIYYKGFEKQRQVMDDTSHYCRYIDLNCLINNHEIVNSSTPIWR